MKYWKSSMNELIKKIDMALIFGVPEDVRPGIMDEVRQAVAEHERYRAALAKILEKHSPMIPPVGQSWVSGGQKAHCAGCDTGDPFEATDWLSCESAQLAREALGVKGYGGQ